MQQRIGQSNRFQSCYIGQATESFCHFIRGVVRNEEESRHFEAYTRRVAWFSPETNLLERLLPLNEFSSRQLVCRNNDRSGERLFALSVDDGRSVFVQWWFFVWGWTISFLFSWRHFVTILYFRLDDLSSRSIFLKDYYPYLSLSLLDTLYDIPLTSGNR